ncbi:MAG: hypothetical protein QMC36_07925 [Patescibacteria group bacterium]
MNAKQKTARVAYFVWKQVGSSTVVPLPQYDVSHLSDDEIRSIDQKSRLRLPNHLPLVKGLAEGNPLNHRIHVIRNGETAIAVALDEDIRQELRLRKAKPLSAAFNHKVVST